MINENPTEPGIYLYKMPHWSEPRQVEVIMGISNHKIGKELHVKFVSGTYPDSMRNMPAAALWEKVDPIKEK